MARRKKFLIYIIPSLFIASWWFLSFTSGFFFSAKNFPPFEPKKPPTSHFSFLSPMHREDIHKALCGDFALMCRLLLKWDVDAELLKENGIKPIKQLSRKELIKALRLKDSLLDHEDKEQFVFPQTEVAAGILLALSAPSKITALPKGIRRQKHLYPTNLTNKIPFDTDPLHLEAVFLNPQTIGVVSPYSHPSTVATLKNRGMPLVYIPPIFSPDDLSNVIETMGQTVKHEIKSNILNTFIKGAMIAIENRLLPLEEKILFLQYNTIYSAPSKTTFTGRLLARLGIDYDFWDREQKGAAIPLEIEKIVQFDPDVLLISTSDQVAMKKQFEATPAFKELTAVKQGRVYFMDKDTIDNTSQFFLLAYYDIFAAVSEGMREKS